MSFISEKKVRSMMKQSHVAGLSVTYMKGKPCGVHETYSWGISDILTKEKITPLTRFQMASMTKVVATAFAIQFFNERKISLGTGVNDLLEKYKADFKLESGKDCDPLWAHEVDIDHMLDHTALDLNYVPGHPLGKCPSTLDLLRGENGNPQILVMRRPGELFKFSGGGFILLQYLIEVIGGDCIEKLMRPFLDGMGLSDFRFSREVDSAIFARGYNKYA